MSDSPQHPSIERWLVVMPSWLGDCVMATPTLRALRGISPDATITLLMKQAVRPVLDHCPWVDHIVTIGSTREKRSDRLGRGLFGLARRLARGRFDAAVLLSNSFRSATAVSLAGIPRRIGYDRDGRGFMLTDRLLPQRKPGGGFVPVPTRDYYLGLALYLGATDPEPEMALFTSPEDERAADEVLKRAGYDAAGDKPLVLLNPGANKPEKRWPAERFAHLADRLVAEFGIIPAVCGAPREARILQQVVQHARKPVLNLQEAGLDLASLKSIVRRARLMVTNDTGPRHIAAAMNTPVVTLFGPTGPQWTRIDFALERQIVAPLPPGRDSGGQGKPRRRRMHDIDVPIVFESAAELLQAPAVENSLSEVSPA